MTVIIAISIIWGQLLAQHQLILKPLQIVTLMNADIFIVTTPTDE